MYPMMNDEILKNLSFLALRVRRFDLSPATLSVIATEMYFRSSIHRFLEYCAWIVLWYLDSQRVKTLSVGIAQIQLKRWVGLGFISSCRPSITNLQCVASVENNYAACHQYLGGIASFEENNAKALSELYSGKARKYHTKAIEAAYEAAVSISLTKASSRRVKCARG